MTDEQILTLLRLIRSLALLNSGCCEPDNDPQLALTEIARVATRALRDGETHRQG